MAELNLNRAKQFMPFAALRGYGSCIDEKNAVKEPRREYDEDRQDMLSRKICALKKGGMIKAEYYSEAAGGYITKEGLVSAVNIPFRELWIVRCRISFDDIWDIEIKDADNSY